jgi:hypothetical protein
MWLSHRVEGQANLRFRGNPTLEAEVTYPTGVRPRHGAVGRVYRYI